MAELSNSEFTENLLAWYKEHKREMPWRGEKDPYKIWISEIMLQQTRVDQAWPYFENFMKVFPTVFDLAKADQQQVLKAWEGLGYYSRARNLHAASKMIVEDYNGKLPETYDEIIKLKGIGPYTAAAITSIAFDLPNAVVDGNVIRVITRYFGIEDDVRKTGTVKEVQSLVNKLISQERPAEFNQGMMELGATICSPHNPDCLNCPIQTGCIATKIAKTDIIPYKSNAKKKPHKVIGVGIIEAEDGKLLIALRPEDAMLGGLWEFPGGKQEKGETIQQTVERELLEELGVEVHAYKEFMTLKHTYSHFSITMHAWFCKLISGTLEPKSSQEIRWVERSELEEYPFPKANKVLTEKLIGDEVRSEK
ncbi:MAG: A/G-specific adenine glycosylase [Balneola sp.]|nr:A/G-specific adenine glycosylase [Balneola sp.]MBO6649526.1 A/G-specific adenine glycosylase [Balneola sp.]MBO6711342.1 A/G-specific adenine glycosylase [Balneola sp.]MBO6801304.1 A/G-specific adenine glycosylase [Balneola sp.]MBO6869278.1 A/G-specific adenine glycosylase [Balneola sp.]